VAGAAAASTARAAKTFTSPSSFAPRRRCSASFPSPCPSPSVWPAVPPGQTPGFKWPNDIWIGNEKTSGILIDAQAGPTGNVALPGIGINVNGDPTVQPELAGIATSLRRSLGALVDRELLLASLCNLLEEALSWDAARRTNQYVNLSMILGHEVSVQAGESAPWVGIALSITADGSLIIRRADGETETVIAAEVTIRPARPVDSA